MVGLLKSCVKSCVKCCFLTILVTKIVSRIGQSFTLSPLAVSLTTLIIRSRKLVHPTAASCVRAGPKAFVKYSKTTPFMSQNFKKQKL